MTDRVSLPTLTNGKFTGRALTHITTITQQATNTLKTETTEALTKKADQATLDNFIAALTSTITDSEAKTALASTQAAVSAERASREEADSALADRVAALESAEVDLSGYATKEQVEQTSIREVKGDVELSSLKGPIHEFYSTGITSIGGEVFLPDTAFAVRRKIDGIFEVAVVGEYGGWRKFGQQPTAPTASPDSVTGPVPTSTPVAGAYRSTMLSLNPAWYIPFDEAEGSAPKAYGSKLPQITMNGSLALGGPGIGDGQTSLQTGPNGYVELTNVADSLNAATAVALFQPASLGNRSVLGEGHLTLTMTEAGALVGGSRTDSAMRVKSADGLVRAGAPNFAAVSMTASKLRLYLNGSLVGEKDVSVNVYLSVAKIAISAPNFFGAGNIAGVGFFSKELSEAEIKALSKAAGIS